MLFYHLWDILHYLWVLVPKSRQNPNHTALFFDCVRVWEDSCITFYARIVPLLKITHGMWVKLTEIICIIYHSDPVVGTGVRKKSKCATFDRFARSICHESLKIGHLGRADRLPP